MTEGYKGLQRVTRGYIGFQEVTGNNPRLHGITKGNMGLERLQGLQGVIKAN